MVVRSVKMEVCQLGGARKFVGNKMGGRDLVTPESEGGKAGKGGADQIVNLEYATSPIPMLHISNSNLELPAQPAKIGASEE